MLSQSKLKNIRSLHINKYRAQEKKFIVEGEKLVLECLKSSISKRFQVLEIFALDNWIVKHSPKINPEILINTVTNKQLTQLSIQKSPNQVVALIGFTDPETKPKLERNELYLGLARIQDPGNVGTIFRLAEWFGLKHIYLSEGTADPLNPKVIQSSMGSVLRVSYSFVDLVALIKDAKEDICVYGTLLGGESIYKTDLKNEGLILIGNESRGLDNSLQELVDKPIQIPKKSMQLEYPESLNAATATGIVLSEFLRRYS